ncbi:unnamed protein product (macronuclear) [Paramecium tetraurelia]|uniref:Uncharacterized protein n=1 Tax=Paramecium tetraurelia TaxID=5888 RepID=A0EE40_PARTE|nr:uncharacterized protein GSPATT00025901001 [Paramecium tetraurelia]CAK93557.1 unnamed protein product [Paramecium tetraurelia]|eukprot:XP_001460954.1 hypothetical protein (macronuclear) [Paramecium tetraurelia strain d4-2]
MNQISSFWNNCKNKVHRLLEVKNNCHENDRVICIYNILLKELKKNHKGKDHQLEILVFVRDSQLNIGSVQCETCFQKQKQVETFLYSLDLMKILEDAYFFLDQVSSCFLNNQQFLEEEPYHQIMILKIMKEILDNKSINKEIIWKINKLILELESYFNFTNDKIFHNLGKIHYSNINKIQMNKFVQNIKNEQQQIKSYRQYIKLLPTVISIRKFHPSSDYIYQQTVSEEFLAILVTYQILIYNLKTGALYSKINVDYQNKKILLFQFTNDENYLIFAFNSPINLTIYNMKKKIMQQIQEQTLWMSMVCCKQNNQNYLFKYNENLTIKQCFSLEQQDCNNFKLFKIYSTQENQFQTFIFYDNMEGKWKSLIRNDKGSIFKKNIQITNKFKLLFVRSSRKNYLYFTLISNSNKKIRKIINQDEYFLKTYFFSKDETYIISSSLTFYEIQTGKIAFTIKLNEKDELLDVQMEDSRIKILAWSNLYIYDQVIKNQSNMAEQLN